MSQEKTTTRDDPAVGERVRRQYTRVPFPPVSFFPIAEGPPKDTNWHYSFTEMYYHAFHRYRAPAGARLLDAGCGTGYGVVYLRHQAPGAEVHAFDFSAKSLELARQRVEAMGGEPVTFHELDALDIGALPGEFDAIFCSGVVHHTADPVRALAQLESKLKPDGVIYLMLYSLFGRREFLLMHRAISLLCRDPHDQLEGLHVGRALFDCLPPANPIATFERTRWSNNHRKDDATFIDAYVNANDKDYSIREVFHDLEAAGLRFVDFTDSHMWELEACLTPRPELTARFEALPPLERYDVVENLDPTREQYHFCASHAEHVPAPPRWLRQGSLDEDADDLTALSSPYASEAGPDPSRPGLVLWRGYFGHSALLDPPSVELLSSCDGRRSARELARSWEKKLGQEGSGKGLKNLLAFHRAGLAYVKQLEE